ncbi:hypothetical protein FDECE_7588 [Fusarium decemcellulare]|nr:hypothetical protein FDECE_7588 [Fusarium decemcellulare]
MPSQTVTSVLLSPCDGKLVGDAVGAEAAATETVATACTTTNIGGNDDGSPTATMTSFEQLEDYEFHYDPVTITKGLDLLSFNEPHATEDA